MGAAQFVGVSARADVPSEYKGKPYKGTPTAIPGHVELSDVDIGGSGVSYHADHNRMNIAVYQPISGNDYRPDEMDLPNICRTNTASKDFWLDDGSIFPSATDLYWHYIGYAHAHDWVRLTVDVKQAGTYTISSNWASDGPQWGLSIWFNDGRAPVDATHPLDGVNKTGVVVMTGTSDFHKWKAYPNFATVELGAGVQLMTFHLEKFDHLQYGFLQFDLVGGGGADAGATPDAGLGAAGASGAADAGATGAAGQGGEGGSVGSGACISRCAIHGRNVDTNASIRQSSRRVPTRLR